MTPKTKPEVKPQPQPATTPKTAEEVKTATAPAAQPTKPEAVSKQRQVIANLTDAWKARGVDVSKMEQQQDGKFVLLLLPNFPPIRIGASGGIDLPTIKSYAKAWDAAVEGDKLLARQKERELKKTATVPAAPPTAKPEQPKTQQTTTAKKQQQHQKIEAAMQA